jgi:phospholipase/carboxylesterase
VTLDDLEFRLRQPRGEPAGAMILMHGRGADESDLYPLFDYLDPERRLLGFCPRGPLRLPPGGAHWYIVKEVGYPDPDTFFPTYRRLTSWLDSLESETGIPPKRTILGGFSQGAVMSYAAGLGAGRPRPAALVCFSGFIPTVEGFDLDLGTARPDEDGQALPVAIGHGEHDPIISVDFGRDAHRRLEAEGADVLYRESPMYHSIDPQFLESLAPWIGGIVERSGASS